MFFKQSLILLFVGIFASAIAADLEEYDVETLRNMLRSQINCPSAYSAYVNNCTQNYGIGIRKCGDAETEAKSKLNAASLESRKKFASDAHDSCQSIEQCDNADYGAADAFGCIADKTGVSGAQFTNMSYGASTLQSDYLKQERNIETVRSTCTNTTTWELSAKNAAGLDELNRCYRTNEWTLFDLLEVVPEPTEAPVLTTVKPVTPVVTENPATSERTPAVEVTNGPAVAEYER